MLLGMPLPRIRQPDVAPVTLTRRPTTAGILAAHAHGEDWARVFDAGPGIWAVIATAVLNAPISVVRDRAAHGVVCVE